MAKPRVFVSSTFYDLRHIRARLKEFIEGLGYEAVLSESGGVPYDPAKRPSDSCYEEVRMCQMMVLIVGGRHGSNANGESGQGRTAELDDPMYHQYKSITELEWNAAIESGVPTFTLVEQAVWHEYATYQKNRDVKLRYAAVDNVSVFKLLDALVQLPKNNPIQPFGDFTSIGEWLRDQWAGLFCRFLRERQDDQAVRSLEKQIEKLGTVAEAVKTYSEAIATAVMKNGDEQKELKNKVNEQLESRLASRFAEAPQAETLGVPKGLAATDVLEHLRKATCAEDFFRSLGFSERSETDGRITFEFSSPDSKYIYFGVPERTYGRLRREYLVGS